MSELFTFYRQTFSFWRRMNQAPAHIRLFVGEPFAAERSLALSQGQSHYLAHVMRCKEGQAVAVFNGHDGEWIAEISAIDKKTVTLRLKRQCQMQRSGTDLWLAFAPIKGKTELVAEKAVELGVSAVLPVVTRHAVVRSINQEKLLAHMIEAAEQCERLDVPKLAFHKDLASLLAAWPLARRLLYGDESGGGIGLKTLLPTLSKGSYGVLIGPEGGFSAEEHRLLCAAPFVTPFGLGPRILKADTASVAALACIQAWLGDWEEKPHFKAMGHD